MSKLLVDEPVTSHFLPVRSLSLAGLKGGPVVSLTQLLVSGEN